MKASIEDGRSSDSGAHSAVVSLSALIREGYEKSFCWRFQSAEPGARAFFLRLTAGGGGPRVTFFFPAESISHALFTRQLPVCGIDELVPISVHVGTVVGVNDAITIQVPAAIIQGIDYAIAI
jgi:hypothetical protein